MDVTGQMKIKLVHGNNLEGNTLNLHESELLSQSGKKRLRVTSTSGSSFYPKGGTLQNEFTESEKSGKFFEFFKKSRTWLGWRTQANTFFFSWDPMAWRITLEVKFIENSISKDQSLPGQVRWWWWTCPLPVGLGWCLPPPHTFHPGNLYSMMPVYI